MRRRGIIMGFMGLAASGIASGARGAGAMPAGEVAVTIDNFTFSPATVTISAGTKVTWTNRDDIPHTVTDAATPRAFRSAALDTNDTFSWVFPERGTFRYFCSLHPRMEGTVEVR
mgnify:CR=1 FL=1